MSGARRALGLLLVLAVVAVAGAAGPTDEEQIRATLRERFPDVTIVDVRPAPIAGLYEVFTGDRIAYVDKRAKHLFLGSLLETASRKNLTATRLDERLSIDFSSLPLERAITVVKGNGRRHLAVFADPDCPYCQELEKTLQGVSDVTIHTFLYPLADVHSDATARAVAIWCAPDRAGAYRAWMLERKAPQQLTCKDDPVGELQTLGRELHINSTPTLFLGNGRRISSAVSAEKLEELLSSLDAVGG